MPARGFIAKLVHNLTIVRINLLDHAQVDEHCRSVSVDNIWGIGDVSTRIPLTPVARMEGTQLALHLFG